MASSSSHSPNLENPSFSPVHRMTHHIGAAISYHFPAFPPTAELIASDGEWAPKVQCYYNVWHYIIVQLKVINYFIVLFTSIVSNF